MFVFESDSERKKMRGRSDSGFGAKENKVSQNKSQKLYFENF
jgi:hypothetical protein